LTSFLGFLVDVNYLSHNPFAFIRRKSRFKNNFDEIAMAVHERILGEEEWRAFLTALKERDDRREQFIVSALYFLGLRIEELAQARWRDCKLVNKKWWFFVCGKNDRLGKIPINSELLHAIMVYRHHQGKPPLPQAHEDAPLIKSPRGDKGLSSRHISTIIKAIALQAACAFPHSSVSWVKLQRLSPHWLRHLAASRQDLAGISFTHIKSNLRHENEQTTRIYVHAFDDERHREMEKLRF
jgi:integrase